MIDPAQELVPEDVAVASPAIAPSPITAPAPAVLALERAAAPWPSTFRRTAAAVVRGARPKQWMKNVLVFAAPGAAGVLGHERVLVRTSVAFAAFCLVASATYLLNDVVDAETDRRHARKRSRPVASGELSPGAALAAAVAIGAAGLALGAAVGLPFLAALGVYVASSVSYSLWLKRVAVVEMGVVASGFIVRAVAGSLVASVHLSQWFLILTSFASLLVVAGKRFAEFRAGGSRTGATRATLVPYTVEFLRFVWMTGAAVAITAYCLWAFSRPQADLDFPWGKLSIVPFVLALLRYGLLLESGQGESPEDLLLADRALQVLALLWLGLFVCGVYLGP
ncbi:MAG: decaprenyl-phosphate phosphoribosyltransferase [Actinomycetota bacterium]|nr:decaprenyl-phosphate phosphoribosyltransferase [Actinomycetota bacterium]